jgi:hypothetical protein
MKLSLGNFGASLTSRANRWSPEEDFVLEMLVGKHSYAEIALRLGRSATAVQRRASNKKLTARGEWRGDAETRKRLAEIRLMADAEDLSAYLPPEPVTEVPVGHRPGDRTYQRDWKRKNREQQRGLQPEAVEEEVRGSGEHE